MASQEQQDFYEQDLFVSGEGGYARYRIPALAITTQGTVLAFCEARKYTGSDSDQIDLFLRRSFDDGRTFGEVQVVATDEGWVCGNPAPVVDHDSGRIWLPFCKNLEDGDEGLICEGKAPREVWMTYSDDDGATWAEPWEITESVKLPTWSWYATGPCHGIQLRSGRLVVPCDHIVFETYTRHGDPHHSHVIFSDDHGKSWQIGGIADEGTNESTVLETADGRLYLNCRNKAHLAEGGNYRAIAWSQDQGESFAPIDHDTALLEPVCQASVCRFTTAAEHGRNRILFSNPNSRTRDHLTVRMSYDEGGTWPVQRLLHAGPAAYSDLCVTREMSICCLYERGEQGPYERITLARFSIEWLSGGEDRFGGSF
jgi:sialidase-1